MNIARSYAFLFTGVTLSLTVALLPTSYALAPVNSVQDGRVIQGGSYYNTSSEKTTFINSGSGGLWLKSGTTVRGLEVNANGNLTNHGGTIQLYAPGNVVRVDGTIDVNAIRNSQGAYLGDGGKVFVDSAYLFQNGAILASGKNGGLVQINVNGATMGPTSRIEALGFNGAGGVVSFNSAGPVDIQKGASINTSGWTVGAFDHNLISIEGGVVNNEGILKANGVSASGQGARGGTIQLVASGQSQIRGISDALTAAGINNPGDTSAPTISSSQRTVLVARANNLIQNQDGNVSIGPVVRNTAGQPVAGAVLANGVAGLPTNANDPYGGASRAGDGGSIIISSFKDTSIQGLLQAIGGSGASRTNPVNGGNGGTIGLLAQRDILNLKGRFEANGGTGGNNTGSTGTGGKGGDGGLIAFGYTGTMTNTGGIYADGARGGNGAIGGRGGNGGLVLFSGNGNPTGHGSIDVIARVGGNNNPFLGGKSGTIVSPDPGTLGQGQSYFQQGYVNGQLVRTLATQQTQPVELLTHAENAILLTKSGGNQLIAENLFDRLLQARIRSVTDPTGALGQARQEFISKNTPSSSYVYRNLLIGSSLVGSTLDLAPPTTASNGVLVVKVPFPLSGGRGFDTLNTMTIANSGSVINTIKPQNFTYNPLNYWNLGRSHGISSGGRIAILADGGITLLDQLATSGQKSGGSILLSSTGVINKGLDFGSDLSTGGGLHGGSVVLKADVGISHSYSPDTAMGTINAIRSNGRLMGGDIYLQSNGTINNDTFSEITANGGRQGGIIQAYAGENVLNHPIGPRFQNDGGLIEASGTGSNGLGGFIHLNGSNAVANQLGIIQANGTLNGGTIALTGGERLGATGFPSASGLFGGPQWLVLSLTPPVTKVATASQNINASVVNENAINAQGGTSGHDGKIYLGGNHGVSFWENGFNGRPVSQAKSHGGHVYLVAGTELQNQSQPGFLTATQIVNTQAAPNHSEPNVNPLQNGQGSELPDDFQFPAMP